MSAVIQRNETAPANLGVDIEIESKLDGSWAPRDTVFTNYLFVSIGSSTYKAAVGTLTNKRFPITLADDAVEATDTGLDQVTLTAHAYQQIDGPIVSDTAIGAVAPGTQVWIIVVDANTIAFATSLANAIAGTRIDITAGINGAVLSYIPGTTTRGIDGQWTYIFAAAEVTVAGCEAAVSILGHGTYQGYSTADYVSSANIMDVVGSPDGATYGDMARAGYNQDTQLITKDVDGNYVVKRPDGADSHHGKITSDGRVVAAIDDIGP